MPNINLIQEQRQHSKKNDLRARAGFFAFVGTAVVFGGLYGVLLLKGGELNSQEASLKMDLQKLEPAVTQIEKNRKEEAEMQPRVASLEEAQDLTDRWVGIVEHFTTQTPSNTWLVGMRATGSDATKPVNISVTGMATSQEPVGEFMLRTQNEPDLEGVTLKFTNEKTTVYGPVIEFEIGADVKGTAPEKTTLEEGEVKA